MARAFCHRFEFPLIVAQPLRIPVSCIRITNIIEARIYSLIQKAVKLRHRKFIQSTCKPQPQTSI